MSSGSKKSLKKLSMMGMVISSCRVESLETTARTLLEAISWVDWWFYTAKSLAICDKSKTAKVKCLFVAVARC